MDDMILETQNISKRFRKQTAVNAVNISVPRSKIYGLLGPNGAGKSTLLKMICGMITPSSGAILFNGRAWERSILTHVGALIEHAPLYPNLTAYENCWVRSLALGIEPSRIHEVLNIVGLADTGKKRSKTFSMGMKQRLGIALALLNRPQLLILDEPANGLDPLAIKELRSLIRGLAEGGTTVILSSHILSEVKQLADHVGIIACGRLGFQGELHAGTDLESLFMQVVHEQEGDLA